VTLYRVGATTSTSYPVTSTTLADFTYTAGLATDGTYLYALDQANRKIYKISTAGLLVSTISIASSSSYGFVNVGSCFAYGNRSFWTFDNEGQVLTQLSTTGAIQHQYTGLHFVSGITTAIPIGRSLAFSNGSLYLGDYGPLPGTKESAGIWPIAVTSSSYAIAQPTVLGWAAADDPVGLFFVPSSTGTGSTGTPVIGINPSVALTLPVNKINNSNGLWSIYRIGGALSTPVTVTFTLTGTAVTGVDYAPSASGQVSIPAGTSAVSLFLTPLNGSGYRPDATVTLTLTGGTNCTISSPLSSSTVDVIGAPLITIRPTVTQDGGTGLNNGSFTVTRTTTPLQAPWQCELLLSIGGTAVLNTDYGMWVTGSASDDNKMGPGLLEGQAIASPYAGVIIPSGETAAYVQIEQENVSLTSPRTITVGLAGNWVGLSTAGTPSTATQTIYGLNLGPAPGIVSGATYEIVNQNSGQVVDVAGNSTVAGGLIHQYPIDGKTNEQWVAYFDKQNAEVGWWRFTAKSSGLVLEIPNSSLTEGQQLDQAADAEGADNKRWYVVAQGGSLFKIVNGTSYQVVSVLGSSKATSAAIVQLPDVGGANQLWSFTMIAPAAVGLQRLQDGGHHTTWGDDHPFSVLAGLTRVLTPQALLLPAFVAVH
jgi:hypothetical protein